MPDAAARKAGLSPLQLILVVLALGVGIAGWLGTRPAEQQTRADEAPAQSRSIVSRSGAPSDATETTESAPAETWREWLGPRGAQAGFTFLGGFAMGFAFRAFLKTMVILTALAVVTLLLLSYFEILNVDLTKVRETWDSNSDWVITQAIKLRDVVWTYLPGSTAGVAGLIVGTLRR